MRSTSSTAMIWTSSRLYIWNDSRGRWSPPPEPANDRHTIAIDDHDLEIRARSDLAAQNRAIEVVEYFASRILRHPAVEQLTVPLSPDNPRTIEPPKPPSLARKRP